MKRLADLLPPEEAHVVRTVLTGTRAWCEAHGESPEDAQTHAALDATSWVHALTDGTLKLMAIEPRTDVTRLPVRVPEQLRLGAA